MNPGAYDDCDGEDSDCDDEVDDDAEWSAYFRDADEDGYGGSEEYWACGDPEGYVLLPGDCDDDEQW